MFDQLPVWVLAKFLYFRCFKKFARTRSRLLVIPALYNLYIAPSLQTESKAPSKSVMIAIPYFPDVIAAFIFSSSRKIAWEAYLLFWYAHRFLSFKTFVCSSTLVTSCKIILSYIFPIIVDSDRYDYFLIIIFFVCFFSNRFYFLFSILGESNKSSS